MWLTHVHTLAIHNLQSVILIKMEASPYTCKGLISSQQLFAFGDYTMSDRMNSSLAREQNAEK